MIKFEHSIFALPFALASAFYASQGVPPLNKLLWIIIAMVSARSSAMAFNRIVDLNFDRQNPRTMSREIPAGKISIRFAWFFTILCAVIFVLSCYMLNNTCLQLSPVALFIILGYSFTKRFTALCHFVLGLSLALGTVGAWLAINERLEVFPILMGTSVIFWVAGFDIIYALMDMEFERSHSIYSLPARVGARNALIASFGCHIIVGLALIGLGFLYKFGIFYNVGIVLVVALLLYQHIIVTPKDFARANEAFFHVNAIISVIFMCAVFLEVLVR